jgi:hypothetical protein
MSFALALVLALASDPAIQVPHEAGLYFLTPQGLVRIEGRQVTVASSHKKLPMSGSLPMVGNQSRAEILGAHANQTATSTPVFFYRAPTGEESTGAGNLVLVRLRSRGNHREFTISAEAEWNANTGIPLRSQVEFNAKQVESGAFRLEPADDLKTGEYGFYLFRGRDLPGFLYDFTVGDDEEPAAKARPAE